MAKQEPELSPEQAELQAYIEQVLDAFRDRFGFVHLNQPDPDLGVLDRERAAQLIEAAGQKLAERCFGEVGQANANSRSVMMLFRAVPGWNRDEIMKAVQQRTQIAIRALGLLPLPEGQAGRDECYERFVTLREYEKVGLQFAAQRRAGEQAAVQAAMANLAQTASFADPTRLVWAMESELAVRAMSDTTRRVGDVTLTLSGEGLDLAVVASRDGVVLASIPAAIKKSKPYAELRPHADELRAQYLRLSADFERLMVDGESFQTNELTELCTLPSLGQILSRLIFRDEVGAFGLYDRERNGFSGLGCAGAKLQGELFLAHPLDLEKAGVLADWQREIVRRHIVQPFKQVLRETYTDSPHVRLAGQPLSARAAGKWLNGQGWQIQLGDMPEQAVIFRSYYGPSVQAVVTFDEPGRVLAGKGDVELRMLAFRTLADRVAEPERIAPADILPVPRSETYRDCDLLGAEALRGHAWTPSREVLTRRAELIAALAEVLPLNGVNVGDTAVEIKASSGTFSVSLADGEITGSDPSHCTVPERWSEAKDLYLPFAGSSDATLAEIAHRVQWLSAQ
jgi:hypothetical protein